MPLPYLGIENAMVLRNGTVKALKVQQVQSVPFVKVMVALIFHQKWLCKNPQKVDPDMLIHFHTRSKTTL